MEEVKYAITISIADMYRLQKDFQEIITNQNPYHTPSESLLKISENLNSLIKWTEEGEISTALNNIKGANQRET